MSLVNKTFLVPLPPNRRTIRNSPPCRTAVHLADRLEPRLATARQQAGQLTPALLAKVFRGELVPQDPADEPATELIKRLAASNPPKEKAKRQKKAGVPAQ